MQVMYNDRVLTVQSAEVKMVQLTEDEEFSSISNLIVDCRHIRHSKVNASNDGTHSQPS